MRKYVGEQLGNYRVLRLLGEGGQASVYLGEHIYLKSQAALKVRHAVLTNEEQTVFLQEAQTLVRLTHPHIVRVLDFAVEDGMPFLVMEYAPHGTLRQRHPRGTQLPLEVIVPYVKQVASALQYTHDQGLIHRDVKPENMLLNSYDQVLLSDFGLVMLAPQLLSSAATEPMEPSLAGTTPYLAPEQLRGKTCPASDQYALGVVVYEWLCGKPPFRGPFLEVAIQHASVPPPSMREQVPDLSPAIEEVVLRALAKEPEQRFARVQDFASALEQAFQVPGYLSPRQDAHKGPVPLHFRHADHGVETEHRPSSIHDLPRGTVTLLFTDMEGSTQLLQRLGDRYANVLAECRQVLRAAFQQWNGYEVDTQGDAFFVAFARASDAVAAQRALASHAWPQGVTVPVRMGLHTGEPQLTAEGYVGLDVHRAARIMSAGHGGQVLLSQATSMLVEHDLPENVSLRDLGEHRLKDLTHAQRLFQLVISNLPADFPPLRTLDTSPNNLPIQPTPFIGREQELTAVGDMLLREEVRLLTLTGPGGTGKTRLGLQVAADLSDRFVDGVFFVALAPISDPLLVMPTIAETLGIREAAGQSSRERLKEALHQKQMLLLLDNFEQVVSVAAPVADLLTACPKLKILVTSRFVLHVRGEQEFVVPPLAVPDPKHLPDLATLSQYEAVALFIARTQAVKPDFQLTHANASTIVEICIRLDGLPLAIELAAARSKLLPPQALLARLGQRLAVLTSGARDMPARQQTLRNTIAWSYHLLEALEQRLFRRLSVFVGGCSLEAIEAVCMTLGDEAGVVLDAVASLIDKSLLQQTEQESEQPRLVMLETIREYGLECLATSGEAEAARHAHAAYYLQLAEAVPDLFGAGEQTWLDRLEWEYDNLRAAMNWLLEHRAARESIEMTLRLGAALWWFWLTRGHRHEGWTFLERALAGSERVAEPVRAKALWAAGNLAAWLGHFERGEALCQESLALAQQIGDAAGMRNAVFHLAFVADSKGDFAAARPLFERSLVLSREADDKFLLGHALDFLAFEALYQGEYARARLLMEEALAAFKEVEHMTGIMASLRVLACVMFFQGDLESARALGEECITRQKEFGGKHAEAGMLAFLGNVTLHQGDILTARMLLEKSGVLLREVIDEEHQMAWTLSLLGKVNAVQGDYTAARACYEESLQSLVHVQMTTGNNMPFLDIATVLEGLAAVVAAQGELAWAIRLWGAAEALREKRCIPLPPIYRADYERAVAAARTQLGEKTFAALWSEGQNLTPEQALAARGPATLSSPSAVHPAAPSVKRPIPYPDGLTAREVEVLRLVAQGLPDTQVAERLVISPRTVNTHLKSIYGKIQVSSRSAATRYALEHHLD